MAEIMLYGARNPITGKLVSDLTTHRKKFWQRKTDCQLAINNATGGRYARYKTLELVTFKLVEIK